MSDFLPRGAVSLLAVSMAGCGLAAAILPDPIFARLFDEFGLVESLTVAAWLVAAVIFAGEAISRGGAVAWLAVPVCIAAALREADLHVALTGLSILKIRFYSSAAFSGWEKLLAAAVVLPIGAALAALLVLLMRRLRRDGAGTPGIRLLLATLALLALSKVLDRSPAVLLEWYGIERSVGLGRWMQAFEEGIELLLPVLFVASFHTAWTDWIPGSAEIKSPGLPEKHPWNPHKN